MPIQVVTNISAAKEYLLEQLAEGTTLAKLVASHVNLSEGRFWFGLSYKIDQSSLNFGSGNVKHTRYEGLFLARLVKSFIRDQLCTVLLQETQMKPSELGDFDIANLAVLFGKEIYWRIEGPELAGLSDEKMLKIVYSASLYPFSGFFVTSPATHETVQFTPKDLEQIARNIVGIAVGAFDEGSFLVWWREAVRQFPLSFEAGC